MNAITAPPEVAAFVEDVRARLADLSDDEREELLGGLEADLAEKVADGAPLGDPASYAAELRAAAGLPERTRRLPHLPRRDRARHALDSSRDWFLDLMRSRAWTRQAWEVVSALRPAWWVARAWLAVTLVDIAAGPWEPVSLVPSLGHPAVGWACLLVAVVGSTLLGLGRLWPGSGPDRPVLARVVLLALNVAALVVPLLTVSISAPGYLTGTPYVYDDYGAGYRDGLREPGIRAYGRRVTNIFAYDAAGRPLEHVQLFDQQGHPLDVYRDGTACPELVGTNRAFNVFPLSQRRREFGSCRGDNALMPNHPLATVPPVTSVPQEAEVMQGADEGDGQDKGGKEERGDRKGQS